MTKAEAIKRTEYTEEGLITLAIQIAKAKAIEWRNGSDDSESWEHYQALADAFEAVYCERIM